MYAEEQHRNCLLKLLDVLCVREIRINTNQTLGAIQAIQKIRTLYTHDGHAKGRVQVIHPSFHSYTPFLLYLPSLIYSAVKLQDYIFFSSFSSFFSSSFIHLLQSSFFFSLCFNCINQVEEGLSTFRLRISFVFYVDCKERIEIPR